MPLRSGVGHDDWLIAGFVKVSQKISQSISHKADIDRWFSHTSMCANSFCICTMSSISVENSMSGKIVFRLCCQQSFCTRLSTVEKTSHALCGSDWLILWTSRMN